MSNIITVKEAQDFMGVASGTDTTLITNMISYATSMVESYIDNAVDEVTITGEALTFDISSFDLEPEVLIDVRGYAQAAFTRYTPVSSATVKDGDDELTEGEDYDIEAKQGAVYFYTQVSDYAKNLTIDYTAGYSADSLPGDLKYALLDIISVLYKNHGAVKGARDIKSKTVGKLGVTYENNKVNLNDYNKTLSKYRLVRI